jgi:uncharacterized membrane protein
MNQLHPGFLAFVPIAGLPIGAVADFLGAVLNRYVTLWWPSPALAQLEWNAVRWMADQFGYPGAAGGTFTSGGSLANFSAVVTARLAILGSHHAQGRMYVTDQTHHSIERAGRLAGMAPGSIVVIPTNDALEMDVSALEARIRADREAGEHPFMVVASAGTTNTGAVDPIERIIGAAHREGLWALGAQPAVTFHEPNSISSAALAGGDAADPRIPSRRSRSPSRIQDSQVRPRVGSLFPSAVLGRMLPATRASPPTETEGQLMAKVEFSAITINRPVDHVFAVLSKLEDTPKWSSTAIEAEITSAGNIGVGATARYVDKFLGRRFESVVEITEFEPNRKLTMQSTSGPFPFRGSVTLEGIGGSTRVSGSFEAEPGGFFKLAEPILVRVGKRQFESDLANLKDLMEANAL